MDKLLGACVLPIELCVSIDLETPNRRGPGIFNQLTGELYHNLAFYIRIDPMEVFAHPSTKMDPATLRWWMLQTPQAAREELFGVPPIGQKYPAYVQDKKLLGNGDNPFPYQYWNIRDLREQIRFTGLDPKQFVKREGAHHNALDDAIFQAKLSIQCTKIAMDVRDLMEQVKNGEIGHASNNS